MSEARRELNALEGIWTWTCPHLGIPHSVGVAAERLLDEIIKAHGANFGSLRVWDNASRSLYLVAHRFDRPSAERFAVVKGGDGTACEAAVESRAPVIVEDIQKAETFASLRAWTRGIGIRAIQTMPVFGRSENFIGAFSTHYATPRSFTRKDNEMNSVYANRFSHLFADLRC